MPEILLSPDTLRSEASKMDSQREQLTDIVMKIKTLVDGLEAGWHGSAQQAFVNSFNDKKPVYDKFAEDMLAFSTFMKQYADAMESTENNSLSQLNF